jgi:hypothetical protein
MFAWKDKAFVLLLAATIAVFSMAVEAQMPGSIGKDQTGQLQMSAVAAPAAGLRHHFYFQRNSGAVPTLNTSRHMTTWGAHLNKRAFKQRGSITAATYDGAR